MSFTLLPAVDVADGQAVRLVRGAAGTETGYGDPLAAALAWQAAGAEWIHLVDLDAAFGRGSNAPLLAGVVGQLRSVRAAAERGVEVDQVDPVSTSVLPCHCRIHRVAVSRLGSRGTLHQPDGLAAGDIDSGQQLKAHRSSSSQLASSTAPASDDFSGWN